MKRDNSNNWWNHDCDMQDADEAVIPALKVEVPSVDFCTIICDVSDMGTTKFRNGGYPTELSFPVPHQNFQPENNHVPHSCYTHPSDFDYVNGKLSWFIGEYGFSALETRELWISGIKESMVLSTTIDRKWCMVCDDDYDNPPPLVVVECLVHNSYDNSLARMMGRKLINGTTWVVDGKFSFDVGQIIGWRFTDDLPDAALELAVNRCRQLPKIV